jgi:cytoplasmic iron level regulating protein YaaA (DUF328/UPF0246 family)
MLVVISPAKSLDLTPVDVPSSEPRMQDQARRLAATMRGLGLADLRGLMDISDDLARLNRDRFRAFADAPGPDQVKPAVLAFDGDTYQGLEARTMSEDALRWAQDHLRILSGLYGLLRPLDGIQPYRLEMGSRLKTRRGTNLYDWWGDRIAALLRDDARAMGAQVLVNCASQEYAAAALRPALGLRVVTPVFQELRDGRPQIVSFYAKRARGAMARFVMEHRLTDPADLAGFATGGYALDAALSSADRMVFSRPWPGPAADREK